MLSFIKNSASGLSLLLTTRVKAALLVASVLPAATVSIVAIITPGIIGAYISDIFFWCVCIALQVIVLVVAGTLNYRFIITNNKKEPRRRWYVYRLTRNRKNLGTNQRIAIVWMECIIVSLLLGFVALHVTNPYAKLNVVQQPYTTAVSGGGITISKNFDLHVATGPFAEALGYYKSGFLIVQNAWFGSYPAASDKADNIINDIHALRFDPSKPYLISGDQFSVLYPRNLGVFYNSLLDYRTTHSQQDWENRQRIYLQSALYALDAFSDAKQITTTIVPVSPRSVALTEVHPGSIASDSLYGILYAFDRLENADKVQTGAATKELVFARKNDLNMLLDSYLTNVQDPRTGLVKTDAHLAAARDGVTRSGSFYDNVVLWKTLQLADSLGIRKTSSGELDVLHAKIMDTFWQPGSGYFKDDEKTTDFSSDWLIALPTGFMDMSHAQDVSKLESIVSYIKKQRLDEPFPIRYSANNGDENVPLAVQKFVPNYGGDAIWSYWGSQYIYLLGQLYHQTDNEAYKSDAERFIRIYRDKIEQTHGFPETFDTNGNFLQNTFYKSIRQTGWVVQFELAEAELR